MNRVTMTADSPVKELDRLKARFGASVGDEPKYNALLPEIYMGRQELERVLIRWIGECGIQPVMHKRLLEIGCAGGSSLLQFLRLGFQPENLVGNELVAMRAEIARRRLPSTIRIYVGNAAELEFEDNSFDIVFQSLVLSTIFDVELQQQVARRMWELVRPGGGILSYDSAYKSPRARALTSARIKQLFPSGNFRFWSVTLAPPISRLVTRVHPAFYVLFNGISLLRTHRLCWIAKNSES
jgi:SAM-dependent methyltransferase